MKKIDRSGLRCTNCRKGVYKETSVTDDWQGTLHCSKCEHEVQRWCEAIE